MHSFCENILFVCLEALRSSERRVVRIAGIVGLTLDKTPINNSTNIHKCLEKWKAQLYYLKTHQLFSTQKLLKTCTQFTLYLYDVTDFISTGI